jgi:hypothetical protein
MIGIVAPKQSGKDTSADYLVQKYNYEKQSFANPLKQCCKAMFSLSDAQLNDPILKETPDDRWFGATPRTILQFVGTNLFRNQLNEIMPNINKDVHIYAFKNWYENNKNKKIVIADVRFLNEAEFVKQNNGILIKINRNTKQPTDNHQSEIELQSIKCDYIIDNNGTLEELYCKIDEIININNY